MELHNPFGFTLKDNDFVSMMENKIVTLFIGTVTQAQTEVAADNAESYSAGFTTGSSNTGSNSATINVTVSNISCYHC